MGKQTHQWIQDAAPPECQKPSRSEKKRQALACQELGEKIAQCEPSFWKELALPSDLILALKDLSKHTSHEARRRQMQFIGRLMRDLDPTTITTIKSLLSMKRT